MTYNNIINNLKAYCTANEQIKTFGTGEEWEAEGILKPGIIYPIFYAIPIDSTNGLQTKQRKFNFICFDIVAKDKSNEQDVLSDTEQILDDIIRYIQNNDDIGLIGEPVLIPFKEKYGDFCAGWATEVIIETEFNSNDCQIPMT